MRNAALILGLIGGLMGLVVGAFGYGYTEFIQHFGEFPGMLEQVQNVEVFRAVALIAPVLAIAGAGMALARALWGGILMLISVAGMYAGFGIHFWTVFPMVFVAVGGVMALAAGHPDEPRSHF